MMIGLEEGSGLYLGMNEHLSVNGRHRPQQDWSLTYTLLWEGGCWGGGGGGGAGGVGYWGN